MNAITNIAQRILEIDKCIGYPEHNDCAWCEAKRVLCINEDMPYSCDFITPATLLVHHPDGTSKQMSFAAGDVLSFGACAVLSEAASVAKLQRELESAREAAQSNWTQVCELERKVAAYEELYGVKP